MTYNNISQAALSGGLIKLSAQNQISLSFQGKTHSISYDIIPPLESRARPKQDSGIGTKRTPRPKLPC